MQTIQANTDYDSKSALRNAIPSRMTDSQFINFYKANKTTEQKTQKLTDCSNAASISFIRCIFIRCQVCVCVFFSFWFAALFVSSTMICTILNVRKMYRSHVEKKYQLENLISWLAGWLNIQSESVQIIVDGVEMINFISLYFWCMNHSYSIYIWSKRNGSLSFFSVEVCVWVSVYQLFDFRIVISCLTWKRGEQNERNESQNHRSNT